MSTDKVQELIENIKLLTVKELSELVKALEEEFGVSACAPVAAVAPASGSSGTTDSATQTEFDVILSEVGAEKIKVIKVVREVTGLGLKEAKELVDGVPKPVKEKVSKEEADELKAKVEAVGAKVQIK